MESLWSQLLANIAIVAIAVSVWTHGHHWIDARHTLLRSLAFGLLMGGGALTVMHFPVEVMPGVLIDLRSAMIALAGFWGGPAGGLLAGAMTGAYRLHEGGIGAFAGSISISAATAVGIGAHLALRGRTTRPRHIVLMAFILSAGCMLSFLALPAHVLEVVASRAILPTGVLTFVGVLVASFALRHEQLRREALASKRIYKATVEALPDCLNVKDLAGRFIAANPATAELMRARNAADLIGKTDFDFYPAHQAEAFRRDELTVIKAEVPQTFEQQLRDEEGRTIWLSTLKAPLRDDKGAITGLITHNRDITVRKKLAMDLEESQRRLSDALAHMADGLAMFDKDGILVLCNEQYRSLFPLTADLRVPGAHHRAILRAAAERGEQDIPAQEVESWIDGIVGTARTANERLIAIADGRWLHVKTRPTGNGGSLTLFYDITGAKRNEAALVESNLKLSLLAKRDGLTDLLTRRAFDEALESDFGRAMRNATPLSLLLLDVDWFKNYNDHYGHPAGDECLRAVARCIAAAARRPADISARYGGEEFAVILQDTDAGGALLIAEIIGARVREMRLPHLASQKKIVTVSVGFATFDPLTQKFERFELLNRADEALYRAKAAGRDRAFGWRPQSPEVAKAG